MRVALALAVILALVVPVSGQSDWFANLSERSVHVLLVTLLESQMNGILPRSKSLPRVALGCHRRFLANHDCANSLSILTE